MKGLYSPDSLALPIFLFLLVDAIVAIVVEARPVATAATTIIVVAVKIYHENC